MGDLSIFSFSEAILKFFFNGIFGIIQGFYSTITRGFGGDIQKMLFNLTAAVEAYGWLSIPILVLIMGMMGMIVFAILMGTKLIEEVA